MEQLLNLIKALFFLYFLNNLLFSQSFRIPENYIEAPLIYSHETFLEGISTIVPIGEYFSKYSKIELSKVNKDIFEPKGWLKDKIFDESGEISHTERLLRSKDSPLSDPIFDQFKHLPMYIDNTLEILATNPLAFCNPITQKYNKKGIFYELNCTIPFGFFHKYLVLRVQFENMQWFFTKVTSLNYYRMQELLSIAETFEIKK